MAYTAKSIKAVSADKLATILFFGDPATQVGSGLKFVPLWIASIKVDTRNYIQIVFGTPTQDKEGKIAPIIMEANADLVDRRGPYRITTSDWNTANYHSDIDSGSDPSDEEHKKKVAIWRKSDKGNALGQRLSVDPELVALIKIDHHPSFLKRVGNVDKLVAQVIQSAESGLQALAGGETIAHILRTMDAVNKQLTNRVEWLVGEPGSTPPKGESSSRSTEDDRVRWWGVDVKLVQIKSPGIPKRVNEAIADAVEAVSRREAAFQGAEAKKRNLVREGEGAAKAELLLLLARAKGYAELAKVLGKDEGKFAAQLDAMQTALSNGNSQLFLLGGQFTDIIESLTGALAKSASAA